MKTRLSTITPKRSEFDAVVGASEADTYLPAATRSGVRMMVATNLLLNVWDAIQARVRARKGLAGYYFSRVYSMQTD